MSSPEWFLIGFVVGAALVLLAGIIGVRLGIKAGVKQAFDDIRKKHDETSG